MAPLLRFYDAHPAKAAEVGSSDWCKFSEEELAWVHAETGGGGTKRVAAPAGSLVLWDSRTAHGVRPALPDRAHPGRWRLVVYTCNGPRALASEAVLAKKRAAVETGRTTNHWPFQRNVFGEGWRYGDVSHFPKASAQADPRTFLTAAGRRLAGYDA